MNDQPSGKAPGFELPAEWWLRLGHDLLGSISPMRLAVQLLKDGPATSADKDEALHVIDRQIDRLLAQIEDVSELLRLNAGKFALNLAADDLNLLLDIMCGRMAMLKELEQREVTMRCVPVETALFVHHDAMRVAALLEYLIRKSAEYAAPGSTLTLQVQEDGDRARFSIIGANEPLADDPELIYLTDAAAGASNELEAKPILIKQIARLNNITFAPLERNAGVAFWLPKSDATSALAT